MTLGPRTSSRPGWPSGTAMPDCGSSGSTMRTLMPGSGMADLAALGADLAEAGGAEVVRVDRHRRRAFGAAVAFERAEAELLLERGGQPLGQLLRRRHHHAQAAEILRRAAAHVELQERRRRQQERQGVLADQRADGFGIERVGMVRHPHAQHRRQAKRAREAEGMEERQDAHEAVASVQAEDLFELLDVRADVVVAEHHALGIARAAAGEDDRRQIVQGTRAAADSERSSRPTGRNLAISQAVNFSRTPGGRNAAAA